MPRKSKCVPSSSSSSSTTTCSLCSVTGLSSDSSTNSSVSCSISLSGSSSSSSSDSCSSSSSSSCPSSSSSSSSCSSSSSSSCSTSSSSSCPSSTCSSSCPSSSSSSSCGSTSSSSCGSTSTSSSSLTYSSNSSSSNTTVSSSCSSSNSSSNSSSSGCGPCGKSNSESSKTLHCVKKNEEECKNLVKNYNKCRDTLKANSDLIVLLEFIKNKLLAVKPNIDCRQVQNYSVEANIKWLESFVDTVFCVLRKNEAYKVIRVKDCKVKNNCDEVISDRLYVIKAKYSNKGKSETRTLPLNLYWTRLTYNDAKSFKGILDYAVSEINSQITSLKAQNTRPFLQ